jgi:hypothetical protein
MKNINISVDTVNAVLQYLSNRPYIEVARLISAIQKEAEDQSNEQKITPDKE